VARGEALEYGIVGLNTGSSRPRSRRSAGEAVGMGREGSKYGILDYTELKYLCIGGIE
jgi:succinate-semialdehyde dehydrogenase/glutarate-semialdehyde dehydrogenase